MKLPPYETFPTVPGDTVSLRQIQDSDINDLVEISFYDAIQATTLEQATEMQAKINKDYDDGKSIHWGIADNLTDKVVGTCGYYRGFENAEGELGCVLLPRYRGQGFMTAAMLLAIEFGRTIIGLKRIWARTSSDNQNAIKLLERLNFKKLADVDQDEVEYEINLQ